MRISRLRRNYIRSSALPASATSDACRGGPRGRVRSRGTFGFGRGRWAVRTTGDPTRIVPEVRRVIAEIAPAVAIGELKPMSDYVDRAMAPTRFSLVLIAVFGAVAAVLAAIGLYGVLATAVRQRTAEIGVRMAFGASNDSIFRLMIGEGSRIERDRHRRRTLAAFALTGVMEKASMLVAIKPTDPATYASIAVLFLVIAMVACWVPARRAAGVQPTQALQGGVVGANRPTDVIPSERSESRNRSRPIESHPAATTAIPRLRRFAPSLGMTALA